MQEPPAATPSELRKPLRICLYINIVSATSPSTFRMYADVWCAPVGGLCLGPRSALPALKARNPLPLLTSQYLGENVREITAANRTVIKDHPLDFTCLVSDCYAVYVAPPKQE